MYNAYMLLKIRTIKMLAKMCEDSTKKEPKDPRIWTICSCSAKICEHLYYDFAKNEARTEIDTKSTADRMYYAQVLIFKKDFKKAISILNSVIEAEGNYSLSVVVFPKSFWESNFLDDSLCKELSKSFELITLYSRRICTLVIYSSMRTTRWVRWSYAKVTRQNSAFYGNDTRR